MAGTQRDRIGAVVLACVAVGLFAAAFFSYIYHWGADWSGYSYWSRRWIATIGVILSALSPGLCYGAVKRTVENAMILMQHERPNQALELTAARIVFTFSMSTFLSPHLTLALGGRSSALSR